MTRNTKRSFTGVVAWAVLGVASCSANGTAPPNGISTAIGDPSGKERGDGHVLAKGTSDYLVPPSNRRVVVFVHGVLGDANNTWRSQNHYWPSLLTTDPAFDGTDVFVYDYPTSLLDGGPTIPELAEHLRGALADGGVFTDHDEVIFLCHSMGGLVVRAFLQKYPLLAAKVPMIYFFGAPTTGSSIAELASLLARRQAQFRDMTPWNDRAYVGNLVLAWHAAEFTIESYCGYERMDTYNVRIVDEVSATHSCNRRLDPIWANHMDMVKPSQGTKSPGYIAFRNAFREALGRRTVEGGVTPERQLAGVPDRVHLQFALSRGGEALSLDEQTKLLAGDPLAAADPTLDLSLTVTLESSPVSPVSTRLDSGEMRFYGQVLAAERAASATSLVIKRGTSALWGQAQATVEKAIAAGAVPGVDDPDNGKAIFLCVKDSAGRTWGTGIGGVAWSRTTIRGDYYRGVASLEVGDPSVVCPVG